MGDISSWFIQELAGIKPNPDCRDTSYFEISPEFIRPLSNAKAHYKSQFGIISVQWRRDEDGIVLCLNLPANTHGRIVLRDAEYDGKEQTWDKSEDERTMCIKISKV